MYNDELVENKVGSVSATRAIRFVGAFYIKTASQPMPQPMPKTTIYSEVIQWAENINLPIQTQER